MTHDHSISMSTTGVRASRSGLGPSRTPAIGAAGLASSLAPLAMKFLVPALGGL